MKKRAFFNGPLFLFDYDNTQLTITFKLKITEHK